ncbi:muts domain V-domain-containing protein [Sphaerosporella brunnea]|uniref:Muts domain V-domain-containing protein n=1 Tax=Sphaerosporella brunnea TaxID=1250544 RepID=A0A5J5F1B5_9PEZI|nr:muts domain V-domain-containing protein [Sphaerosporella brunnea]
MSSSYLRASISRPTTSTTTVRPMTAARPRTAATSTIGGHQHITCAVTESRGVSATVGLCFVNLTTGECYLSEICDSQTYVRTMHKLTVYDPSEILVPQTSVTPVKSTLLSIIEHYMPDARIVPAPRKYYSEQAGHEYIQQLACADDLAGIMVAISAKFYAVSAAAAALKHVTLSTRFQMHTLRVKYQASEGSMMIDPSTVHGLELIQNLQNEKSTDSLFGLLNNTGSAMGARLLRTNILQPLTEIPTLNSRLDAVEEFTQHEEMFFQVKEALKGFPDVDRLCAALIAVPLKASLKHSEQSTNNIILLKQAAQYVQPVFEALAPARCDLLVAIRGLCAPEKIEPILTMINNVINEDVSYSKSPLDLRNQRCYAVKSGVNGLLDVARQTYKEATEDVHKLVEEITTEHDILFELRFEAARGYFLRIPASDIEDRSLPPVFVNVVKRKRFVELSTLELMKRNKKIGDSLDEVLLMSDRTVQQLIEDVGQEISGLFKMGEGIGMLDMLCSFAVLCSIQDYVRPEFTDTLAVKALRHPIREKIHKERFVPNDVYASQQSRFQIVTGCNMSGKSTYLRSIALAAVMAQIGSFVPAQYASFPMTLQLFARISMDDSIEANVSTFASEMRETAFILRNVSRGSMVIVDELGRGTSPRDGMAIALAVCEALVESRALVWFATHFREITEILAERAGVVNLHMQVEMESQEKMTMLYKIADGSVQDEHYGLILARLVQLPQGILDRATQVSAALTRRRDTSKKNSEAYQIARRRNLVLKLLETLVQARDGRLDDAALRSWLLRVQEDFVERMALIAEAETESEEMEVDEDEEEVEEEEEDDEEMDDPEEED